MKHLALISVVGIAFTVQTHAEVLEFKNGDKLTGEWQRVDGDRMIFKAEIVGIVTVSASKVKSMTSQREAAILLTDGNAFRGMLSLLESGDWELKGEDGGVRVVPSGKVMGIYPLDSYMALAGETEIPRPWQNWSGSGSVGYSLVRGDRDAGTLSVGVDAVRREAELPGMKERFRTNYLLTMLFANTRTNGIETSANSISTKLRQDFLFSPTNFVFALGQWEHIQTQSLNLRQTYGAGIGHDLIRRAKINLQLLGGLTYVRESFQNAERRNNAEALVGEKLAWKLSPSISLGHSLDFYPNLSDTGAFRVDTTTTLGTRINTRLSFNTTLADRYLSRPLPGRQRNEVIFTTGLGVSF